MYTSIIQIAGERLPSRTSRGSNVVILLSMLLFLFLYNWTAQAIPLAHVASQDKKVNIESLVRLQEVGKDELHLLARQTGLHPEFVETILQDGRGRELLRFQQRYFAPIQVAGRNTTPLTISEILVDEGGNATTGMPLADIHDGDILITKNSRFFGWRNGHAALVVDAEKGLVLEAVMLGLDTQLRDIRKWSRYPSFQVLRLKAEYDMADNELIDGHAADIKTGQKDIRNQHSLSQKVAEYAQKHLVEIPYSLTAGLAEKLWKRAGTKVYARDAEGKEGSSPPTTHCAHLVWYAYEQFGLDLDSDGGLFVTPEDIRNSKYLEIIQTYGY